VSVTATSPALATATVAINVKSPTGVTPILEAVR
jgi:hypothetical protein